MKRLQTRGGVVIGSELVGQALALAGWFAAQRRGPITAGSLPGDSPTFGVLVFGAILLTGALCFLLALALGPIVEFPKQH